MRASCGMLLMALACLAPLGVPASAAAQEFTFEFQLTIGGATSGWHTFGLREDALPGIDAWDLPEPPAPPGATFLSYLSMFDPPDGLPNRWLREFRPVSSVTLDRIELWQFVIAAPTGSSCRLDVRARDPIGTYYDLYFFGPGTNRTQLLVPASVMFPIDAPWMIQFFELRLDSSVATGNSTWGGVKGLFR
ncbi:MAG: hypothetical protein IPH48_20830 [bacterium]|nr:hypothetical protein [bacterium]